MNDLYVHQLETENKQLREQLKLCRTAINEIKEELNKTIDAKDKIINEQISEISKLKDRIDKAKNINQYIIDYGFDYDGLNTIESLKGLIDMLVDYARQIKDILGDKE